MRTRLPSSPTIGRSSAPTCTKLGSISSSPAGIATQHCSPCSGSPPWRRSGAVRSECAIPRPAVIQLTSPGRIAMAVPRLSRCMISPSNRNVTVASPICGCGRTSMPCPVLNSAGPKWSKKMKGPTMRRLLWGRARRTEKPPRSTLRGTMVNSMASQAAASPGFGSLSGLKLMVHPRTSCRAGRAAAARRRCLAACDCIGNRPQAIDFGRCFEWQAFVTRIGHPSSE